VGFSTAPWWRDHVTVQEFFITWTAPLVVLLL
jgi:hypothetical protein